ncbi:MAG: peptidylprolyl isomerase [Desulfobacterales bacterium]|nr:MAG: peptidylprolyl isomerase [Desulfobacterales bacterium]
MQTTLRTRACLMAALLIITLGALPALAAQENSAPDNVATVNGKAITKNEYDRELNLYQQNISRRGVQINDEQLQKIKTEVLESLINRELLYQECQKQGIRVDAATIDNQLNSIKQRFAGEAEFEKAIAQMNLTEAVVKSQIERGMAIEELINKEVNQKVEVSAQESQEFYDAHPEFFKQPEQIKASHILVKVEPNADESQKKEARKKIEEVQSKVKKGEDFAALAKEFSEGPSNVKGGDLGYFGHGQMVEPFDKAAFALKPNEVSDIVETRFGYHLIKVYDKKPEKTLAYEEVKERLVEKLKQDKAQQELRQYIDRLKKDAKIEKSL